MFVGRWVFVVGLDVCLWGWVLGYVLSSLYCEFGIISVW